MVTKLLARSRVEWWVDDVVGAIGLFNIYLFKKKAHYFGSELKNNNKNNKAYLREIKGIVKKGRDFFFFCLPKVK